MAENQGHSVSVAVSGIGMISAAGNDVAANFANMLKYKRFSSPFPTFFSSDVSKPVFECDQSVLDSSLLPHQRTFALCINALAEALTDAELEPADMQSLKVGVCIGTTVACTLNDLEFYSQVRAGESPDILPLKRYLCGDISLGVADLLDLKGPTLSVANACSSGTNAIAIGYSWIKSGLCDVVIAGGTDELNLIPYCGFNSLQVMSDELCLPFDERRKGLNLGEGAGILILENSSSASSRGVTPEVDLLSCGEGSDAYHITGPHPQGEGLKFAIEHALKTADMTTDDIDYINAHGTATRNNDEVESLVFAEVFGNDISFSSTKYFTGHTLGAAGAIEAVICVKGIREGSFPGMLDLEKASDVAVAPATSEVPYQNGGVLSTSMAFGGSCAVLLFAKSKREYSTKTSSKNSIISLNPCHLSASLAQIIEKLENPGPQLSNTSLNCLSTGIIGPFGWGNNLLRDALYDSFSIKKAEEVDQMQIAMIPEETLKDSRLKRIRRRADRLSLAMYCAALEATESATEQYGKFWQEDKTTALISLTTMGAYKTTFKFLDGILDFGQLAPSPTHFSNSVHNAPAFYITSGLNITGPSVTVTGFNHSFQQALILAEGLLKDKYCDQVLLVAGDEVCDEFFKMSKLWFTEFNQNIPGTWGEGAVAFLLNANAAESSLPLIKSADIATAGITEKIFGKTLINEAFAMAAEIIRES